MALGEGGQLGAVRGGLGPQFRGAQREPVLVQHLQPPPARAEQAARLARRVRPERLAQPAGGPGHRRAAPPAPRDRGEMPVGLGPSAEVQGHPPGQQVRIRGVARAEFLELGGG